MEKFAKSKIIPSLGALLLCFAFPNIASADIELYDYGINVDGTVDAGVPGFVDPILLGLDPNGLGTMQFTITGTGDHSFSAFFDFEIDEQANTFFNESGSANGALTVGQSWEIDEPGYLFGDIYDNMLDNTLDNTNSVPAGQEDDVSFALGWDFDLLDGQVATIMLMLGLQSPTSGFYLEHTDLDSAESIYYSSTLAIGLSPIPVPAAIWLFGSGLVGLVGFSRRKQKSS
jgi:hypothetical protein